MYKVRMTTQMGLSMPNYMCLKTWCFFLSFASLEREWIDIHLSYLSFDHICWCCPACSILNTWSMSVNSSSDSATLRFSSPKYIIWKYQICQEHLNTQYYVHILKHKTWIEHYYAKWWILSSFSAHITFGLHSLCICMQLWCCCYS